MLTDTYFLRIVFGVNERLEETSGGLRIGSLFSGIGGLELGLERAGVGKTSWQCEIDPFCRQVLAKHWPNVTRYEDVREVHTCPDVDLLCGGFPCQDVSSAGKRAGLAGARSGLWREYLRIVRQVRPHFVVVENVTSGAKLWLPFVRGDLEALDYRTRALAIAAADVGAPHLRRRIFVVADLGLARLQGTRAPKETEERARLATEGWRTSQPDMVRVVHGVPRRLDRPNQRIKALGNSVVPQCAFVVGLVIKQMLAERT